MVSVPGTKHNLPADVLNLPNISQRVFYPFRVINVSIVQCAVGTGLNLNLGLDCVQHKGFTSMSLTQRCKKCTK
jgi:hypothetical protein